jgi:hypothetical protein
MKKFKYLKYNNNPTPRQTPNVVSADDFFRLSSLRYFEITFPKKKKTEVAISNIGIIFHSAKP